MSLQSLVIYVSELCARRGVSLYAIGHRHDWNTDAIEDFLHERKALSPKMLRDLAEELGTSAKDLQNCLGAKTRSSFLTGFSDAFAVSLGTPKTTGAKGTNRNALVA